MYISRENYFNSPLIDIEKDSASIEEINRQLQSFTDWEDRSEDVNAQCQEIAKKIFNLQQNVEKNLTKLQWAINNLDPNIDTVILQKVAPFVSTIFVGMSEIAEKTNKINIPINNELKDKILAISTAILNQTNDKLTKVREEITTIEEARTFALPTEREVRGERVTDETQADLLITRRRTSRTTLAVLGEIIYRTLTRSSWATLSRSNWATLSRSSWIFSVGRLNNPIPCLISRYYGTTEINDPERLKDITSLLKGERVTTQLQPITDNTGIVLDQYKQRIEVPGSFATDITRTNSFRLNEETLFNQKKYDLFNPNEIGRKLYRSLGEAGASRVMYICNQALMPFVLIKLMPRIMDGGDWKQRFPDRDLIFSQDSGFIFDVSISGDFVHITSKILMRIDTKEDKYFSGHFVVKTEITIPKEELCRERVDDEVTPFPNLTVREIISTLIVNNKPEARELLGKL